ncbi:N-acetylmuramate alpha-1-phosphate uridylyltransferase MurU [Psychrobium sp. 1_MG-2023]|uniref:N-acetylmuramate alpha-1-phosphate uridylyltransferase MurU n=1 Tax=Psychrobium sp. 1_MG-2023 TaxID=3062624 RepID=UPI000C342332|nr:nucleotidyltransferase family protein [Psychrobium sp. 1_MG-2023]MDP2559591.1 nucleotidyltransferase family protein [Psychrobium sp. 1_MG-2023]PKF59425.1 mannose-1-phosphate guanylyltransferase [Alteromonadales bacterium alter-6D02]
MYAMILAAGRGERMRPLTDTLPKPLLTVLGKPLIVYHLEKLQGLGVTNVVINQAWLGEKLQQTLGDGEQWGLTIHYSNESDQALETAGGINKALPLLGAGCFIVVNGDVWTDYDFLTLPKALSKGQLAHLVLVENPEHNLSGDFAIANGLLAQRGNEKYTFSGIGLYHRDLFEGLASGPLPLAPLLRAAMDDNQIAGEVYRGRWTDVGTPQRLAQLEQELSA